MRGGNSRGGRRQQAFETAYIFHMCVATMTSACGVCFACGLRAHARARVIFSARLLVVVARAISGKWPTDISARATHQLCLYVSDRRKSVRTSVDDSPPNKCKDDAYKTIGNICRGALTTECARRGGAVTGTFLCN